MQTQSTFSQLGIGTAIGRGVVDATVRQPKAEDAVENPHATRYAYGAGLLMPAVNPRTTGMQTGIVPQGALVAFKDFRVKEDNFNLNSDEPEVVTEVSAYEAITAAYEELGAQGFIVVEPLTGVENAKLLNAIFDIVHPEFSDINIGTKENPQYYQCPEGLPLCPTCRLALLDENFIEERIASMASNSGVSADLCRQVAAYLRRQNRILQTHYRNQWSGIKQELDQAKAGKNGALRTLFPEHHYIRACLHESSPEEQQAIIANAYGAAQAEKIAEQSRETAQMFVEAIKEVKGSSSDDKFLMLMEQMQRQTQQTQELIKSLVPQQVPAQAEKTEKKSPNK